MNGHSIVSEFPSEHRALSSEEKRENKKKGDKNPVSPVVTEGEEINQCEFTDVDWIYVGTKHESSAPDRMRK